jgi:ribosomal protein S18 acetylase RimI-like enzyme
MHDQCEMPVQKLHFRPVSADDLSASKTIIDSTRLFPSDLLDEMIQPFLTGGADETWLLAVQGVEPVGLAYCAPERMTEDTWNLLLIAVREDWQGKGIGAALTRHLEATLVARSARLILVETSSLPAFARTRAVYRRLGYSEVACIPEFYARGEDKIIFSKKLGH